MKRVWPMPVLAGLGLAVAVIVASASTAAPDAFELHRVQLSRLSQFAAYPDIGVGANGLVAVVWTEGANNVDKHNGPLRLAWVDDNSTQWMKGTVDGNQVFDAAVAVSGSTVHIVWSRERTDLYYTACRSPDYSCAPAQWITAAGREDGEALQVDIAVDGNDVPHVVWVEDDNWVYYTRKTQETWDPKQTVPGSADGEGPAIAYANGFIHLVWTEWQVPATDSVIQYCRRGVIESNWSLCVTPSLSDWVALDYLARNLSIAADDAGNVYVVWDVVSQDDGGSRRQYAISYKHSGDNGDSWHETHTYPKGSDSGREVDGAEVFRSGEGNDWVEYVQFLRPNISLVVSDTVTVPVLAWHAQVPTGGGEEGLAQAAFDVPHKVFWTYATEPGSYDTGYLFWREADDGDYSTLSTQLCGEVDMAVDSATVQLALVGDLNTILVEEGSGSHLHATYHEEIGGGFWGVFYNSKDPAACFRAYLPLMLKNASIGGGE